MYMGIHWKSRHTKGRTHHYTGCLMSYRWKCFQGFKGLGHLSLILFYKSMRQMIDTMRLHRRKPHRLYNLSYLLLGKLDHIIGIICLGKEQRSNLIHPRICTLGREDYSNKQCIGILVMQWHRRVRVKFLQLLQNKAYFLSLSHLNNRPHLHLQQVLLQKFLCTWYSYLERSATSSESPYPKVLSHS